MSNAPFDFHARCSEHDCETAAQYIGSLYRPPDLVIAPAGYGEYLFRWYVVPRNSDANVYFHVQTASDPERPLHDHPWDNVSVILAGGYVERIEEMPWMDPAKPSPGTILTRDKGAVIYRKAAWAHRLIMPPGHRYSMSLFSTGPKVRHWGFWQNGKFTPYSEITVETAGRSTWKGGMA